MDFTLEPLTWLIWVFAYMIGGIPFSYIFGRLLKDVDLREYGSGNLGATNTLRILGKGWGFLCLFLDVVKGAVPVYIALEIWGDPYSMVVIQTGIFAILGHIFTPYLGFRGGKGVATSLGVFAILSPYPILIAFILFLIVAIFSGYIALGSIIGALSAPISFFIFYGFYGRENLFYVLVFLALLIVVTHRSNIQNIKNSKERKIYQYWS